MEKISSLATIPALISNTLTQDYLSGTGNAAKYFTQGPLDFPAAFEGRKHHPYPRQELARILGDYNAQLGSGSRAMENARALADPATFCVIGGQQAGFLGGPVYVAYKIITTIRLAEHLQSTLGKRVIPIFWLASEDHDFDEINHAYFFKPDGEVGEVKFGWDGAGQPIERMPITENIQRAYEDYFQKLSPAGPNLPEIKTLFAPQPEKNYSHWLARFWARLFADSGLVIVEPRLLRPLAADFFQSVLRGRGEIGRRLGQVAGQLAEDGYAPALDADRAGRLYTFGEAGRRVRVEAGGDRARGGNGHPPAGDLSPQQLSTDVALRPLLADSLLPIIASVLGPGETSYHAMLKPLYEFFNLPQPLYYPRQTYSVVSEREAGRMAKYQTSPASILSGEFDSEAIFNELIPEAEAGERFKTARKELEEAFAPLRPYVEEIDPNLGKAWKYGLSNALRGIENLEEGARKARLSQLGFSRGELRQLRNTLLPRDRPQERVLPLPHFLNRYGMGFLDAISSTGAMDDFSHHVITLETTYDKR